MTQGENQVQWRRLLLRLMVTGIVLALWFWSQALIGARAAPASGIGDAVHNLTARLNSYFSQNSGAANALLVVSSALIDALGVFLLARWFVERSVRPFLGLVLLLALRQMMQAICALPAPPNMIWHYPGFPSLLVTYHVANDFFFSGHTAIAVFGALELARYHHKWLTFAAVLLVFFAGSARWGAPTSRWRATCAAYERPRSVTISAERERKRKRFLVRFSPPRCH